MRYTYIIKCADGTLYTGITTDPQRRIDEHNGDKKGATYTKSRRPVSLIRSKTFSNKSDASKEEYRIKKLTKEEKIRLIEESEGV